MMMTSDIALTADPTGAYPSLVRRFARDPAAFEAAFAAAWYKLTTKDMGPVARCVGPWVPPAQPWQFPLPPPPAAPASEGDVRALVAKALVSPVAGVPADVVDGAPWYGALAVRLAFACASSFREADYMGGCDGARVRWPPQSDWPANGGLDDALAVLAPVKAAFAPDALSWADLIVLAGTAALERWTGPMPFCGGRSDARDGGDLGARYLAPARGLGGDANASADELKADAAALGLSARELVALAGSGFGRAGAAYAAGAAGYDGVSVGGGGGGEARAPLAVSSAYFAAVLETAWAPYVVNRSGYVQYASADGGATAMRTDVLLKYDAELSAIAQDFAADEELFLAELAAAWTKLMNADRFDGPAGNLCAS